MTTPLTPRLPAPKAAGPRLLATAAVLLLLVQVAPAQDSDDDGVLPLTGLPASGDSLGSGGGGGSQSLLAGPEVLVAGELQDEIDARLAAIEFATADASAQLVTEAPAEEAAFLADPPGIAAGSGLSGPVLQGSGTLSLPEGLQARFVPAQAASKSVAVLVIAKDGPGLATELAGAIKPGLVVPLGAATPVDLAKLAAVAARFGGVLPGYHATIVFASVQQGELHTSAVRAHTSGGPIDVLIR